MGVWICPGVEVCFTEKPQMSLETLQEKYIYIIRKGDSHVWQSYNVESCYLILRSHVMCMETHTLGFQTPCEEVFGPKKKTYHPNAEPEEVFGRIQQFQPIQLRIRCHILDLRTLHRKHQLQNLFLDPCVFTFGVSFMIVGRPTKNQVVVSIFCMFTYLAK